MNQDKVNGISGITLGMKAPNFTATTTMGNVELSDYNGKWVILFSHPGAFSAVCATEFLSFAKTNPQFEVMNTYLLALNIDSNSANLAWIDYIYQKNDVIIPFPVISDRMGVIAKRYDMIPTMDSQSTPVRNVFFIDPDQIIRAILVYPSTTGRSVNEILRIVKALQVIDNYPVYTPANWLTGNPVIAPTPTDFNGIMERYNLDEISDITCLGPFWCYKDLNINQ